MLPIRDKIPSRRFPLVMVLLIMVNVLIFLFEVSLSNAGLQHLVMRFGLIPATIAGGSYPAEVRHVSAGYVTLLTSLFLHGGWLHVIGNMWYLWIFGDNVEDRMGHGSFLLFYLLGGVAAGVAHIALNPDSPVPTVGASGAIAAVLGAYVVLYPGSRIITLVPIFFYLSFVELPALVLLGFWFVFQLFSGVGSLATNTAQAQGGVAYWAHIGGFLFGILALPFFLERWQSPREPDRDSTTDNDDSWPI